MAKILAKVTSKYNGNIQVVSELFGRKIVAGGLTQSGGIVEDIWKRTLARLENEKFEAKKCLILGLGGGSAAKIIKKKWPNAKITGVDIDEKIIDLGKKYLGLVKINLDLKIEDAFKFTKENKDNYDLIIVDIYNGDKFPGKFESEGFLGNIKKILSKNGIVIFNRLYGANHRSESLRFGIKLEKVFDKVDYFYPQANLEFICYN